VRHTFENVWAHRKRARRAFVLTGRRSVVKLSDAIFTTGVTTMSRCLITINTRKQHSRLLFRFVFLLAISGTTDRLASGMELLSNKLKQTPSL
jgi:hypothetical protein